MKLRGAPHTARGHGGAARQSKRRRKSPGPVRVRGFLRDVLEPETETVDIVCDRCGVTGAATRYTLRLKPTDDDLVKSLQEKLGPHIAQWMRLPDGWWALEGSLVQEEGKRIQLLCYPFRCGDCMGVPSEKVSP